MIRAVIRLRSDISVKPDIKETLRDLRLNQVNHCTLVPASKTCDGMLGKVKDYVTWGEVKSDVLARMILTRGRLTGNRPVTNQYVKDHTKYETLVKFADAVMTGKENYTALKDVKPVFRLHPPLRGHEGIKRSFNAGGALGYRGGAINDLIVKMLGPETEKTGKAVTTKTEKKAVKPKKTAPAKKVTVKTSGKKPTATKKIAAKKDTKKVVKK